MGLSDALADQTSSATFANPDLLNEGYLLSALLEHTTNGIYIKDQASRFVKINCIYARLLRLSNPNEATGKTDRDFFGKEYAEHALQDESEIMHSGLPMIDKEERKGWPNGATTWVSTSKKPLFNSTGECIGILGISRDITNIKESESTQNDANCNAELMPHEASDFPDAEALDMPNNWLRPDLDSAIRSILPSSISGTTPGS
jgi:PAS domain S-box-containing protein